MSDIFAKGNTTAGFPSPAGIEQKEEVVGVDDCNYINLKNHEAGNEKRTGRCCNTLNYVEVELTNDKVQKEQTIHAKPGSEGPRQAIDSDMKMTEL